MRPWTQVTIWENYWENGNFLGAALSGAQLLSQADQEQLTELAKANELWKNTAVATTSRLNADLQLLMGHYTESDLRRLIGIAKSLECFKRLEQHDQERLLKGWANIG